MTAPKKPSSPRPRLSLRKKLLFTAVCTTVAGALAYLVMLSVLSEQLYRYLKSNQRSMHGRVYGLDAQLGFAALPGKRGDEVFPIGPSIPTCINELGMRVPESPRAVAADAEVLLALGCSFTFGSACVAEDSFTELVGAQRSMRVRNAAGGGYGLVQMLRLARRHLPHIEEHPEEVPSIVLVQFAPWLIARARNNMAPSYYGRLPVPYFAATNDESLDIRGPVFQSLVIQLPLSDYYSKDDPGRLSFYWSCGFPLYVHDHYNLVVSKLSGWPPPELDRRKVIRLCYGEIAQLCQAAGARMLVVMLGGEEPPVREELERIAGIELVDAELDLRAALSEHTQHAYEHTYGHWRGEPKRLLDTHPNPLAHQRIAASIQRVLDR